MYMQIWITTIFYHFVRKFQSNQCNPLIWWITMQLWSTHFNLCKFKITQSWKQCGKDHWLLDTSHRWCNHHKQIPSFYAFIILFIVAFILHVWYVQIVYDKVTDFLNVISDVLLIKTNVHLRWTLLV